MKNMDAFLPCENSGFPLLMFFICHKKSANPVPSSPNSAGATPKVKPIPCKMFNLRN